MARLDTRLEVEGAEFLVLGALLLARVPTYKTYTNMPGYDLVATNPERNRAARIQVKSRWQTDAAAFPINNFGCDFVVYARLNRGSKSGRREIRDPEFYVFPVSIIRAAPRTKAWGKVQLKDIRSCEKFRDRWDLIRKFLRIPVFDPNLLATAKATTKNRKSRHSRPARLAN